MPTRALSAPATMRGTISRSPERNMHYIPGVYDILSSLSSNFLKIKLTMATLDSRIEATPFTSQTKNDILLGLWPLLASEDTGVVLHWEPYFYYYEIQSHHALHHQGKCILIRTHQHVINIVRELKDGRSRAEIRESLSSLFMKKETYPNEDEVLYNSIDLAVRLYSMVNIGTDKTTVTGCRKLSWKESSLGDFLENYFNALKVPCHTNTRFDMTFTAHNMERIAGIKVYWSANLADHLRIVEAEEKIVVVFHHASFLQQQIDNPIFPPGLIQETLRTLALLFPRQDSGTKRWLHAIFASTMVDRHILTCKQMRLDDRQLETFDFWQGRLLELKKAFDTPRTMKWSQLWHDRRDGHLWYGFWLTMFVLFLTVLFGLVQSIEGGLQVYKAYHPSIA
jgi:hypothetical protein